MTRLKRQPRLAKRSREMRTIFDRLKPEEAKVVLDYFLAAHPELCGEAEQIAKSVLKNVSFECVADEIEAGILSLDLGDLNSRAGRQEWGYVEPTEAAWELLEETVEPFWEDIKRKKELGLDAEALEICKGILLGLYRLRNEENNQVLGWAPDFLAEAVGRCLDEWVGRTKKWKGQPGLITAEAFVNNFVLKFIPEWNSQIAKKLSGGIAENE